MVIAIFGESCTGKSTLAARLASLLNAEIWSGKDYLRLAKSESVAKELFRKKLENADTPFLYVTTEKESLALLPENALRVLVTAELEVIQARFAARMHGTLPPPVAQMLEKKHSCFDDERHDLHFVSERDDLTAFCDAVLRKMNRA